MPSVSDLYVESGWSIRDVMERISHAASRGLPGGIALVVSDGGVLDGVVTDGDIRRALLSGVALHEPVAKIAVRNPILFDSKMSYRQILEEMPRRIAEKSRYRGGIVEKIVLVDEEGRAEAVLDFIDVWRNQDMRHRHVCVVGMGFVGLTLAVTLADSGFRVTGVEQDGETHDALKAGRPHFHEVGLETLLCHHLGKNLRIETDLPQDAEVYVVAVGTPIGDDGAPDILNISAISEEIGKRLTYGDLVVIRSTVPVGTCRDVVLPRLQAGSGLQCGRDFHFSFAPERTVEGKALEELRSLPQIVGGYDANSVDLTANLFRELTTSIITVDSLEEAEMVKLVNNGFRDLTFAFANELALICEQFNIDATSVVRRANEGYPRGEIPVPSPGVGGVCLKKDPYMLVHLAEKAGLPTPLSRIGREVNERIPEVVVKKVLLALDRLGKSPERSIFFLIGFAFKGEPETSDIRGSTTVDILSILKPIAGEIRGYDPVVGPEELAALGVNPCPIEEGFRGADCCMVLNNHRSYSDLDIFSSLKSMNRPSVYCDCWQIFAPKDVKQVEGVTYVGLGFER